MAVCRQVQYSNCKLSQTRQEKYSRFSVKMKYIIYIYENVNYLLPSYMEHDTTSTIPP